ncbi:MAG TPA: hypothetical protein VJH68_01470 [Candidatus Nanoarchaeia archaeon]|nr:hypothetical protein [Candidatus Nanoarchaeia archaeon]
MPRDMEKFFVSMPRNLGKVWHYSLDMSVSAVLGAGISAFPPGGVLPPDYNFYFKPLVVASFVTFIHLNNDEPRYRIITGAAASTIGALLGQMAYPLISPYI